MLIKDRLGGGGVISAHWKETEPLDVLYKVPVGCKPAERASQEIPDKRILQEEKTERRVRQLSIWRLSRLGAKQAENPETSRRRKMMPKALQQFRLDRMRTLTVRLKLSRCASE